jgi:hypothetical protein
MLLVDFAEGLHALPTAADLALQVSHALLIPLCTRDYFCVLLDCVSKLLLQTADLVPQLMDLGFQVQTTFLDLGYHRHSLLDLAPHVIKGTL